MKRVIRIIGILLLSLALAGCADQGKSGEEAKENTVGQSSSQASSEEDAQTGQGESRQDAQGSAPEEDSTSEENSTPEGQDKSQAPQEAGGTAEAVEEDGAQEAEITVYISNVDATGFEQKTVKINSLSPEQVLGALTAEGVVPADVGLLNFREFEKDGEQVLDLDLSEQFGTYLKTLGSTGEYLTMGCVCNTFLDAYDCEKVHITVQGETLATGHAEYPGYLQKFQ